MSTLDAKGISDAMYEFLKTSKNPALFAGAGVGARAGLPTWPQFMEHLATVAGNYESLAGALIRKWTESGQYLSAAAVYKICPEIPRGELYKQLAIPFCSPPSSKKLRALVSLPFSAIFTTNYDRSLHDAYASVVGKSAITVELEDPTMSTAPYLTDFYIARIHGRAEVPQTIVFAEDDYKRTEENEYYIDLVRHALTRYSCLLLGFSFVDPAIDRVFQIIEDRLSPGFPELHLAILPADADKRLKTRLARFNIRTVRYEVSDRHSVLWEGIKLASRKFTMAQKIEKPTASFPLDAIKRFIATSYARAKLEEELQPLRDIVVDGIVIDILMETGEEGATLERVSDDLKKYLSMSTKESRQLAQRRIEVLSSRGWCRVSNNVIRATQETTNVLEEDLNALVDGVINRIEVREGQRITSRLRKVAARCIEEVLVARGWDLGAHYAGPMAADTPDILSTVSSSLEKHGANLSEWQREGLWQACYDLFQHPSETESAVLAELGRVAFGLQLVINSPCATIAYEAVLPERNYLDASVLMPAIVEGHPYRPVYVDAIRRLGEAASAVGMSVSVAVAEEFLNEIIAHREIARREVEAMSLENPETLAHHILYHGADRVNVFVGAYGSWVGRLKEDVRFGEFLRRVAPYRSVEELARYLEQEGIETVRLYFKSDDEVDLYYRIKHALTDAYESDSRSQYDRKEEVLIDDEARQLTLLIRDLERGLRSVFVTADMRLRRLATGPVLGKPGSAIISHRGLVQLIDMLVGLRSDPVSLTRLFWGGGVTDEATMIRDYFTNLALQYQEEAMAMSVSEVLKTFVPEVTEAAKRKGISLFPGGTTESKARTARFLDRFEDRFYADMAEAVHRRFPEEYNLAEDIRREHLERQKQETLELIKKCQEKLRLSDDPKEKAARKKELTELREYLDEYKRELATIQ